MTSPFRTGRLRGFSLRTKRRLCLAKSSLGFSESIRCEWDGTLRGATTLEPMPSAAERAAARHSRPGRHSMRVALNVSLSPVIFPETIDKKTQASHGPSKHQCATEALADYLAVLIAHSMIEGYDAV